MKRISLLAALPLLLLFCGKDDPGKITIDLEFDSSVNAALKSSIEEFVFIIGKSGSSKVLLYPSACLGCSTNADPCPQEDQCLKSDGCGFLASADKFDPEINFADVAEGENMTVISCALDDAATPVSSGSGTVRNKTGSSATITMSDDATACINKLPPVCE